MGCDIDGTTALASPLHFNPRTPYGVRPRLARETGASRTISIHAPRMGCDVPSMVPPLNRKNFNPRTPYGVRQTSPRFVVPLLHFNPRTPYGVRPMPSSRNRARNAISIHAPRMGCDVMFGTSIHCGSYFNPRTPYGVRPGTDEI